MYRSFERKPFILDGIRPLDFSKFDYEPSKLSPKLSQLVPKFHGEWDESSLQHLDAFYIFLEDYEIGTEDQVMKLFVRTLKDNARQAYESLPTQSISSWKEFEQWFLYEFHDASEEDDMCYERCEDQSCNMEEVPNMSPLDAFFNLERFEGESSAHLFMRMVNIYQKIPVTIMPSRKELMRKIKDLRISLDDPDLKLLFQILEEDDEDKEEEAYDQIEQRLVLDDNFSDDEEDSSYISPLDAFLNLEKQEEESAVQFFKRMFNICQEIPSECRPPSSDLFNRMKEVGLLYDHQFITFLKLVNNELVAKENECITEITYESSEVSDLNGEDFFGQSEERSFHDDTCITSNISECKNEEEDSLSEEEISALLDIEYQRHVEKNGPKFFSIHHGKGVDGSVHIQEALDEGNDNSQESNCGNEIELHEQEEVSRDSVNEDICLSNETLDNPDNNSHESMPEFSMFQNPLFEEDPLCNGIHQHHNEDNSPNFKVDEVHSEGEISFSSSYENEIHQTYEDEMKSAKHDKESVLKYTSENFRNVLADQTLGETESVILEDKVFSKPFCEEKKHPEYRDGEDSEQEGIQIKNINLEVCMINQNLLFSKGDSGPDDFSRAEHIFDVKDRIDEAMRIVHKDDASNVAKLKVLHERNQVFDRGKKRFSLLGGLGPPYFPLH